MRATSAVARHKRKKRIMKRAKGFRGGRGKLLRAAKETIIRADKFAYRDRKVRKREFRKLWIIRINAASRAAAYARGSPVSLHSVSRTPLLDRQGSDFSAVCATA